MYIPLIVVPLAYSDVTTMKDDPGGGDVEVGVESVMEVDAADVLAVELAEVIAEVEDALEEELDVVDEGVPPDEAEETLEVARLLDAFPEDADIGSDAAWFVPTADEA